MKIAYLFLVYGGVNNPNVWERYFEGQDKDKYTILCHAVDREETKQTKWLADSLIPFWISTGWGTLGLVIAQLELTRRALFDPEVERIVLCSGSCVPITTFETAYDKLFQQDKSWVSWYRKHEGRMARVTTIPREHHLKNSQWVALTRRHAELLVRLNFTSDFVGCRIPDEHYVSSVLSHLGEQDNMMRREQTHSIWHRITSVQMTPIEHTDVSDEIVETMHKSGCLFSRKYTVNSNIYDRWPEIVGE